MSASPKPLDFTLAVHGLKGETVLTSMSIQPYEKLTLDMRTLLTQLQADVNGTFAEGSIAVYFVGTIMPLVGQVTVTNPARGLIHESEMVENDPGRSDIPEVLNSLWWGLGTGRDARIMVSNTGGNPATADIFLDFLGERHISAPISFLPNETKVLSVTQLLADLNTSPSQAPEGGITIVGRGPAHTLIAQGKITDPVTGFSTTLGFPDPARQPASALHAVGLPIGAPTKDSPYAGAGVFAPHVIARNLLSAPQAVTITIEYPTGSAWNSTQGPGGPAVPTVVAPVLHHEGAVAPSSPATSTTEPPLQPSDLTGQLTLAPLAVGPYSTLDFSLDAVMGQLPLPLAYCSIRIQYSGAPGTMIAQVASVDQKQDLVVDARAMNEGDGWAGSGANPWHLDAQTESILFLTNESDKSARIGFAVTAKSVHYYLTKLKLAAHETRAIDLRKLRDAQAADFKKNQIPAAASDGSVLWARIDKVPVVGRLLVIRRGGGTASSYDCSLCNCPLSYLTLIMSPTSFALVPGDTLSCTATGEYWDCNTGINWFSDVSDLTNWSSDNTAVVTMSGYVATAVAAGTVNITAEHSDTQYEEIPSVGCYASFVSYSDSSRGNVQKPSFVKVVSATTNPNICLGLGCELDLVYQVLDVNQLPIGRAGMTITETVYNVTGCTSGVNTAGTATTDTSGTMVGTDQIWSCCPSNMPPDQTCNIQWNQQFTVTANGTLYPVQIKNGDFVGSHNLITIQCHGGQGTCPTVVPQP